MGGVQRRAYLKATRPTCLQTRVEGQVTVPAEVTSSQRCGLGQVGAGSVFLRLGLTGAWGRCPLCRDGAEAVRTLWKHAGEFLFVSQDSLRRGFRPEPLGLSRGHPSVGADSQ